MPRLIEVQNTQTCASLQSLQIGDVLLFHASGGQVRDGDAVELLGSFMSAVVGDEGEVLTPAGPPNTVLFHARRPGRAQIEVVTGDPFHSPKHSTVSVIVQS